MAEPKSELILQNVDQALLAIDGNAPFYNAIGENNYRRANVVLTDTDQGPYPFIAVAVTGASLQGDTSAGADTNVFEEMEIEVGCWIGSQTNVHRDLRRAEADIRHALWLDPYRGGLAHNTWWTQTELLYPLNNEDHALVVVHFTIPYEVTLSDLTATTP